MEAKEAIVLDRDGHEIRPAPPRTQAFVARFTQVVGLIGIIAAGTAAIFAGFALIAVVLGIFFGVMILGTLLRALGLSSGPRVRTIVIRR